MNSRLEPLDEYVDGTIYAAIKDKNSSSTILGEVFVLSDNSCQAGELIGWDNDKDYSAITTFGNNNAVLYAQNYNFVIEKYNNWSATINFDNSMTMSFDNTVYCFNKDASVLYIFCNEDNCLYALDISNNMNDETIDITTATQLVDCSNDVAPLGFITNLFYVDHGPDSGYAQIILINEEGPAYYYNIESGDFQWVYNDGPFEIMKYYSSKDSVNFFITTMMNGGNIQYLLVNHDDFFGQNEMMFNFGTTQKINDFILNPNNHVIYVGTNDGVYTQDQEKIIDGIGKVTCLTEDFIFTDKGIYAWPDDIIFHKSIINVELGELNTDTLDWSSSIGTNGMARKGSALFEYDKKFCLKVTYEDYTDFVYHYGNGLRFYCQYYPGETLTTTGIVTINMWTDEMIDQGGTAETFSIVVS